MSGVRTGLRGALGLAVASLGTSGCASLHHAKWAEVTSVQVGGSDASAADGFYADAVAAIEARDYGRALDLLQLARRERRDVRVLNAFGVVYDKLGRFDLSARYYQQALMLEPASPLVRANMAYSRELQDQWRAPQQVAKAAPPPPPAPSAAPLASARLSLAPAPAAAWPLVPVSTAQPPPASSANASSVAVETAPAAAAAPAIAPAVIARQDLPAVFIRTGALVAPQPVASQPLTSEPPAATMPLAQPAAASRAVPAPLAATSAAARVPVRAPPRMMQGVALLDGAGDASAAERLRRYLSGLKWSAGPVIDRVGQTLTRTVIRYPETRARLAKALARSLPGPVTLSACATRCGALQILLGSDVRHWRTSAPSPSNPRRG